MARSRKLLTIGAVSVAAFALAASTSVTGAYFSEAAPGTINGEIGAVHLWTSNTTFNWTNMMPGEKQTSTVGFANTGTGPQDFYIVFPNVPALHALNNLGTYGEVHVSSARTGAGDVSLFDSANLQDGRHPNKSGNLNSCGNIFASAVPAKAGCWPLPVNLKIASNVAKTQGGSVSFSFNYGAQLSDVGHGTSGGPGVFNGYPLKNTVEDVYAESPDAAGPDGTGLPFKIVAVQVGQTP